MSAFDDDDFQGNYVRVNDFADEDDDIADNWEDVLDEDEIEEKRKQAEKAEEERKEAEKQRKLIKRAEEKAEKERIAALLNAAPLSPEEILKRQVESSQSAAMDLFGSEDGDGAAPAPTTAAVTAAVQHLTLSAVAADSVDNYVPVEPEDFTELCRRTALKLRNYNDDECYAKFVKDLTLELCKDMVSEDIKKVSNALINVAHEKSRQEKEAKKKAQSGSKKTTLQVSKKAPTSSDLLDDYHDDQYGGGYYDDDIDFIACQSIGLTHFSRSARELWSEHWPDRPEPLLIIWPLVEFVSVEFLISLSQTVIIRPSVITGVTVCGEGESGCLKGWDQIRAFTHHFHS
eukprot:sb/3466326/